jgi:phosphoglycolate phosphatase-like HAD superfamily hydrolase
MMDFFEEIVTRDSRTPGYSGKSEMLSELLLHHRLPPESAIMVGDTAEDEEAAAANHLAFIHATYGYGSIATARRTISYFPELWSVLSKESTERV